ncbi:CLUMA_CG011662, isoform A [Clunio marinus]|uniref:CLUMA_CG011662, isoform A n=1 Tax=Clunio marinus TaxID=568069 RepID=A0A1J1IFH4_9DIPT|nr:CLUMA_CG011662, isoform A [Clunio marinus]
MSWITKAENLLNKIDQSAAIVLQSKEEVNVPVAPPIVVPAPIPKTPSAKNVMILSRSTPKKAAKSSDVDEKWETMSETNESRKSSISSKHDTVIDQKSLQMKESSSNVSLNSFSVEKELTANKILVAELRSENNELKGELEALMEQIKVNGNSQKIQELEDLCASLVEEKKELTNISQSLENSSSKYVKTISELETAVMKLQQNENDLKHKLDYAKNETRDITNELQQYRLRAQNQLQLKEKMIEQLKFSGDEKVVNGNETGELTLQVQLEELKSERDHLQSEVELLTKRFDESRNFIEKMEHKHRMMQADAEDKLSTLENSISQLNLKCSHYEEEIQFQKQEIARVREEMLNQKTVMTTKLHDKENELRRMKNSVRESQVQIEIENRMQSLTQSLLSKQNNLENVTAERNGLKLQFEKLSHQHEALLLQMRQERPQIIHINETDDAKSQVPNFMMVNPFDSRMSRRVKRAYSNLDQLGVRLGVFLRRYPLARISSIFYVALLHIFVVFVLLSSTPSQ